MANDVIDEVLGLSQGSDLFQLREQRAELKHRTQTSYQAALKPSDPRNLSNAMRAALAARMARLWNSRELAEHYDQLLGQEAPDGVEGAIGDPKLRPEGLTARLEAIIRHVDLVTLRPKDATRADIERLYAAGLDDRDIVTLANLIALVNYQILVTAGLRMLRDN
ncbi:CMD domain protein [Phyllobacterium sp. 0TCS1.6C]|uniref:CMD domain protein n=1 Tax=unclassified Phyllobacterium TaxID=2638441 RepID=UPI0022646F27|nr:MULTISPECIES: CMD domain protein [unclassified Phyllobacterium]MCX8280013.1 CMD domain protein [Phyllobacterium sp. 0TCS1.6C]MCX8296180.1 CMD domain protein [Phyllobacterium sp. 0TCS1.6A]